MLIFISLGIVASIFQLVLLREFSFTIAKQELGLVLAAGVWIIFCSLGSIIKLPDRFTRRVDIPGACALCFSFSVCLTHLSKSLLGIKYYQALSLGTTFLLSLALVGPGAYIIGLAFRQFSRKQAEESPRPENVYAGFFAWEAAGFFLGGISFSLFFGDYGNPLAFSLLPLILLPALENNTRKISSALLVITVAAISVCGFNTVIKKEFAGNEVLFNAGSRYGPVIAVRKNNLVSLFSGGALLATNQDKQANEEFIHISMSAGKQAPDKDILFIGPAVSGQLDEIARYDFSSLTCLQINPLIEKISEEGLPERLKAKTSFIPGDPRAYLKNSAKQYDIILMNMPAPANLTLNRYFTEEFFRMVKRRLNAGGIFSFFIPSKREILSPQFARFDSSILNALDKVFPKRLLVPSDSMLVIATEEKNISGETMLANFKRAGMEMEFFTPYHFRDYLEPSMRAYTESMLDKNVPANTDLNPSGFLNWLVLEQNKFYPGLRAGPELNPLFTLLLAAGLALIIALSLASPRNLPLFNAGAVGFTSIGLSSVTYVLFQIFCAALFWKLGILVALFMAGISAGVFCGERFKKNHRKLIPVIYFGGAALSWGLFMLLKNPAGCAGTEGFYYFYSLLCGIVNGYAYPLLAESLLQKKFPGPDIAAKIYSSDLAGAFLGTLASGVIMIPFFGILQTLFLISCLNIVFALRNLRG
ncbi:MAG: hypothetical protein PHQ84_05520 [Candidatus Omnitrophica bacterium]|jgi:spermidine synthase|nr:hypothetical protein [Candidatus Omnitrophota bacterium]MDD3274241.1 hypothetical protein [Candidatus Omnitrophota bacterium]MDD5078443.1 hypothetical protein [Candidatus Omnitrophota bacterium]MDD5724651.1 hypothetical protein [Candidatus Omnitrophota bacterium]